MTRRLSRYWLFLYWAGFAALVLEGGRNPGFVTHPEQITYPWLRVIAETIVLAVLTMWLGRLLHRPSPRRRNRWLESTAFVATLVFLASPILVTDQAGDAYAVAYFSTVTLLLVLIRSVRHVTRARLRSSSSDRAV